MVLSTRVYGLLILYQTVANGFIGRRPHSPRKSTQMNLYEKTRRDSFIWVPLTIAVLTKPARGEDSVASNTPAFPPFDESFPGEATLPFKGKQLPLKKFRAKATIVVNIKMDDPQATTQLPALAYLNKKYASDGLRILAFPTDQGW